MKAQIAWIVEIDSVWNRLFYTEQELDTWLEKNNDAYVDIKVRKVAILDVLDE